MKVEVNNPIVDNYWIETYESGIICLTINTVNKGCDIFRCDNNAFVIEDFRGEIECILNVPEIKIPKYYLCTETQCKDQYSYYWIPIELVTNKVKIKDKILKYRNE